MEFIKGNLIKITQMFFKTSRLKKNIFSVISVTSFKILTQIFFPPLMIFFWGVDNFGIWVFLISIPSIIQIFNFNLTDASINQMAIYNAQKKYKDSNKIFQNTIVFVLLNILFFSMLLIIFNLVKDFDFTILNQIDVEDLKIILILLFSSVYLKLFESIFTTSLYSIGKINIGNNLEITTDFFAKFLIIFSGIFYNNLIVPALIYFIFNLLRFLFKFYFFIKLNNQLNLSFKYVSKKIIIKLIKLSIGHMSDIWSNLIRHSGVIFIIGIFLNPYMVGYISTVKTLFYFFPTSFFLKINSVTNYEFSNLFGKKKFNSIKKFFFKYIKIILIFILSYFIISILIGPYVYKIWLNNEYQLKTLFLLIIIIDACMFILRQVMISPLTAINKNITLGISDLIFAIIGIMLFFLSFYFENDYIYAFTLVAIFSSLSLVFSLIYSLFYLRNIKKIKKDL